MTIEEGDIVLPDVLTDLQDRTQLTRKSLVRILTECGRLTDFKRNPQAFIEIAGEVINRTKRLAVVDGIKYQRIGEDQYYAQELFQQEELTGYLHNMLKDAEKSLFEHVIYDSGGVERTFAEQLEKNEAVKIYAKLRGLVQSADAARDLQSRLGGPRQSEWRRAIISRYRDKRELACR